MDNFTQDNRLISISDFGLGKDTFLLTDFQGGEFISDIFSFDITVLSEKLDISPKDIVGHPVTINIDTEFSRIFNGVISEFSFGEMKGRSVREYSMKMVPWFWLLTKTNNHRIFQNKNAKGIICDIFTRAGFTDFDFQAKGGEVREYCIQHNESDFDFVSRLLEEEGIAYYFTHSNKNHGLVLTDQASVFQYCRQAKIEYFTGTKTNPHIYRWNRLHSLKTGRWTISDYDFKTPQNKVNKNISALLPFASSSTLEHYEYPALYKTSVRDAIVKLRMESEESDKDTATASSQCSSLFAGGLFELVGHEANTENGEYLITKIEHKAFDHSYLNSISNKGANKKGSGYHNFFQCIPANTPFRPKIKHTRPVMKGAQSAIVVGPPGEEIFVDDYGRIKVQFIWDREGQHNENSSCFLRVMQVWAGNKWGASFIPRIGHEVIVDFLDGDPDRPIVSGTVYNGKNRPPYTSKTQSGIKSRSTKGASASNFNELRFDDKFGDEQLYIQAEKNQVNLVKNNETTNVGNDRKEDVGNNETISIGSNRTENVGSNEEICIGSNRKESVGGNETIKIGSNRTENVGSNETVTIAKLRTHNVGINDMVNVGAAQEVTVGGFRMLNVGLYQNRNTGLDLTEKIGKKLVIDAGDEITIKTGEASINMKSDGSIIFSGTTIKNLCDCEFQVTAKNNVTLKGKKISEN
ncbi:Actin cross-linking toxin VgrG1 [Thalassocella blandensis]|nr:Actin cross-linking toxin VgrG1 [Thalassocella blandensis]